MTYISCKHCRCRSNVRRFGIQSCGKHCEIPPSLMNMVEHNDNASEIPSTLPSIGEKNHANRIKPIHIGYWRMVQPNTWEAHQQKPANSFHSVSIPWKILLKSKNIQTSNIPIDIKLHGNIMKSFFYPKKMMTYFHRALNWLQGSSPNSTFTAWSVWLGWPQLKGWLFSPQLPIGENGHSNGMIMWTCAYYTLEAFFFLSGCHMSWSQWQQLWEVKEVPKHQACPCTRKKA